MRRLLTAAIAASLLVAGLVGATPSGAAVGTAPAGPTATTARAYDPPPIRWGRCELASLRKSGARCGMLTVPLDYAKPGGQKVRLAVSRIEHTTSDRRAQGPMLVNPGGPGGSGLPYAVIGSWLPKGAGDAYDWIGFDPRGVGASRPALSCDTDIMAPGRPAYVPETAETADFWRDRAAAYAQDCAAKNLPLLKHDDTRTWVQDMESLRRALGERKISFYGFSYGTYLGAAYASVHPNRVHRFVFDGVVQPSRAWYGLNLDQERQFDANIDTFFDWIAANDEVFGLGTDGAVVRQTYYDILDDLTDSPLPDFGAADWNDIFVGAGYYVYGWNEAAQVLVAAADGRFGPAKAAYGDPTGPGADNTYATYLAVECTDAPWPSDWDVWEQDAEELHATAPFLTWNNTWYNAPCLTWPVPPQKPLTISGKGVPPILMVAETNDAATPFAGALEMRSIFKRSVLVEGVGGTTHSGSLSGIACTDNTIARYLWTGDLPARRPGSRSDKQCDPVPPLPASAGEPERLTPRERLQREILATNVR